MKTRISLVFVALVAALTIPAVASANGGGHHGPPPPPPIVTVLFAGYTMVALIAGAVLLYRRDAD